MGALPMVNRLEATQHFLYRKFIAEYDQMMLIQPLEDVYTMQMAEEKLAHVQQQSVVNPAIFQPLKVMEMANQYMFVYDDFQGQSLYQLLQSTLSLHQVLQISIKIATVLEGIHQRDHLYGFLNPKMIFVQPQTLEVKMLSPETMPDKISQLDKWSLVYLAPEQTGRIRQQTDERVDLYALGSMFYEMITDKRLFEADNEHDCLFDILTKNVDTTSIVNQTRMPILGAIVQKLLAKNVRERYQTASSLKHDLIRVFEAFAENDMDVQFKLAEMERQVDVKVDGKLYGREVETQLLERALQRACKGETQLFFLTGASGMGKSSLARSVITSTLHENGYFVEGKFDQLQKHYTFEPIIAPIRELLKQVYLAGDEAVARFKKDIGKVELVVMESLLQLIPEMAWFLASEDKIVSDREQSTMQVQTYIFTSIQKILSIFAHHKRPIVMFIDDLQWASDTSVELLKQFFVQYDNGYLLFIVAMRDDENGQRILHNWQRDVYDFQTVHLELLSMEDITEWVYAIIGACETAHDIAQQLTRMTQGNPYFTAEAFRMLLQTSTLYYDTDKACWQYRVDDLAMIAANHELSDFIAQRINLLSEESRHTLQVAACFGQQFDFQLLLKLLDLSYYELLGQLHELMERGFIMMKGAHQRTLPNEKQSFQFVHDGVQQTVYESLDADVRLAIHLQIGQLLQKEQMDAELLEELVRQLNCCKEHLSADEHEQLALWNAKLGMLAKTAGLVQNARYYFLESLALLPKDAWRYLRQDMLRIYMNLAECEWVLMNQEASRQYIYEALAHTETKLEKLRVYYLMTLLFEEQHSLEELMDIGFKAMDLGNMNIPRKVRKVDIAKEVIKVKWALRGKSDEALRNLPPIMREEIDVLMQVMISFSRLEVDQNLSAMLFLRLIRLQLKYGRSSHAPIVYINYALILISGFKDVESALRFGNLAMEMANESEDIYIKARVYFVYTIFLHHWQQDLRSGLDLMREGQRCTNELGMTYITTSHSCFVCHTRFIAGDTVEEVAQELMLQKQLYSKVSNPLADDFLGEMYYWMQALMTNVAKLDYALPITLKDFPLVMAMHYTIRLQMAYLFNDRQVILTILDVLKAQEKDIGTLPIAQHYYFFRALCHLDIIAETTLPRKHFMYYMKRIKESIYELKLASEKAPHQYEHLYILLLAENEKHNQLDEDAKLHYDRAIQLAKVHEFLYHEAIFYERAARFYYERKDKKKTQRYIAQSIKKLRQWGAPVIAEKLVSIYSHYIVRTPRMNMKKITFNTLDVLEATHSLANEMTIEDIYGHFLKLMMKQANATRVKFIKRRDQWWDVNASVQRKENLFYLNTHAHIATPSQMVLIHEAEHQEVLIKQEGKNGDLSIYSECSPKTILCMPIVYKGEIDAFVYLENDVIEHVFQLVDSDMLKFLALQLLIAVENAEVYAKLEERVDERTKQLAERNIELQNAMERLEMSEQERKQLFQSVSHELRSPITSSLGYIEAILDGIVTGEAAQQKYLLRSKERLLGLNRLIHDLFDFAKLEAGRLDFQYTQLSTAQLYNLFSERFEEEIQRANLTYESYGEVSADYFVIVDVQRIEQVVENLMMNAMKYTAEGYIHLRMYMADEKLWCEIADSGIGIPKKDIPFVFRSYFRASNNDHSDSHGMGLAICKKIIEQHDGELKVDSTEQVGTTFTFSLPLVQETYEL